MKSGRWQVEVEAGSTGTKQDPILAATAVAPPALESVHAFNRFLRGDARCVAERNLLGLLLVRDRETQADGRTGGREKRNPSTLRDVVNRLGKWESFTSTFSDVAIGPSHVLRSLSLGSFLHGGFSFSDAILAGSLYSVGLARTNRLLSPHAMREREKYKGRGVEIPRQAPPAR